MHASSWRGEEQALLLIGASAHPCSHLLSRSARWRLHDDEDDDDDDDDVTRDLAFKAASDRAHGLRVTKTDTHKNAQGKGSIHTIVFFDTPRCLLVAKHHKLVESALLTHKDGLLHMPSTEIGRAHV